MLKYINGKFEPFELKFKPDTSKYHAPNDSFLSELVKSYIKRHGESGVNRADILDIYGLSLERTEGALEIEDMLKVGILAGLAIAERENKIN